MNVEAFKCVERVNHLAWLAGVNESVLKKYFSTRLVRRFKQRIATRDECLRAHDLIEEVLYTESATHTQEPLSIILRQSSREFRRLTDEAVARTMRDMESDAQQVYDKGHVPVLIRPEMLYLQLAIERLLVSHNLEIVARIRTSLTFQQYWVLYEHVYGNRIKEMHVHRRAFGYLNRPCILLLLRRDEFDAQRLSEYLINRVKGDAGFYESSTLRGDVIFAEVSRILAEEDKQTLFALDPLMQYVHNDNSIYRSGIASTLHANLQGVHIPEPHEVLKDLCVFLKDSQARERIASGQ